MDSGRSGPLDSQGRPVRLYHGTNDDFTTFEVGHKNSYDHGWLGRGIYLTDSSELADTGDVDLGLQADPSEWTKAPLPVVEVNDLEATLSAVTAAGAAITKPIFSFPGGRRFHFLDPSGNELAAMQADAT